MDSSSSSSSTTSSTSDSSSTFTDSTDSSSTSSSSSVADHERPYSEQVASMEAQSAVLGSMLRLVKDNQTLVLGHQERQLALNKSLTRAIENDDSEEGEDFDEHQGGLPPLLDQPVLPVVDELAGFAAAFAENEVSSKRLGKLSLRNPAQFGGLMRALALELEQEKGSGQEGAEFGDDILSFGDNDNIATTFLGATNNEEEGKDEEQPPKKRRRLEEAEAGEQKHGEGNHHLGTLSKTPRGSGSSTVIVPEEDDEVNVPPKYLAKVCNSMYQAAALGLDQLEYATEASTDPRTWFLTTPFEGVQQEEFRRKVRKMEKEKKRKKKQQELNRREAKGANEADDEDLMMLLGDGGEAPEGDDEKKEPKKEHRSEKRVKVTLPSVLMSPAASTQLQQFGEDQEDLSRLFWEATKQGQQAADALSLAAEHLRQFNTIMRHAPALEMEVARGASRLRAHCVAQQGLVDTLDSVTSHLESEGND